MRYLGYYMQYKGMVMVEAVNVNNIKPALREPSKAAQGDGAEAAGAPGRAPSHSKIPARRGAEVSPPCQCCCGGTGLGAHPGWDAVGGRCSRYQQCFAFLR